MQHKHGGQRPGAGRPTSIDHGQYVTVRLPRRDVERVDEIAAENSLSRSQVIRTALARWLRWRRRKNTDA